MQQVMYDLFLLMVSRQSGVFSKIIISLVLLFSISCGGITGIITGGDSTGSGTDSGATSSDDDSTGDVETSLYGSGPVELPRYNCQTRWH